MIGQVEHHVIKSHGLQVTHSKATRRYSVFLIEPTASYDNGGSRMAEGGHVTCINISHRGAINPISRLWTMQDVPRSKFGT